MKQINFTYRHLHINIFFQFVLEDPDIGAAQGRAPHQFNQKLCSFKFLIDIFPNKKYPPDS
jgi:hypothetical protein